MRPRFGWSGWVIFLVIGLVWACDAGPDAPAPRPTSTTTAYAPQATQKAETQEPGRGQAAEQSRVVGTRLVPTHTPTLSPTPSPTLTPSPSPTLTPTPSPTLTPTPSPTPTPTPSPTLTPTPSPTLTPTPSPTLTPTPSPTLTPTPSPTLTPTPSPTPIPVTLEGSATSPNAVQLTWSLGVDDPIRLELYRDGDLVDSLSPLENTYRDLDRGPNTRYSYRLVLVQSDGTETSAEHEVATLTYRPMTSDQMATHSTGFQQPIIDELNPDHTEYRITLAHSGGHVVVSDWSTSKCRTFEGLRPSSLYRISVFARNLDGIETRPANQRAEERGRDFFPREIYTWPYSGTDDPWVKERIADTALIFGLTEDAVEWMNNNILIEWRRGEPGWAGHLHGRVTIGHSYLATLMHETMHAFWQLWDGFPEPCDQMNFYTFRRDVAQFALDFREYELSQSENPLEPWRAYYDLMVGLLARAPLDGEDFWEVLKRGEYGKVVGFYHLMETELPRYNPGSPSLIPPSLRKYVHGFVADGGSRTWDEEFAWYSSLAHEDFGLWHPFLTHEIAHHGFVNETPRLSVRGTKIPEPLRTNLRKADRQMLVDFINTLEDQKPWEWRRDSPGFWEFYVTRHIYRLSLYEAELDASVGIELEQANLDAIVDALRLLYELHCTLGAIDCGYSPGHLGARTADEVREAITDMEGISDVQRRVLLEMVDLSPPN